MLALARDLHDLLGGHDGAGGGSVLGDDGQIRRPVEIVEEAAHLVPGDGLCDGGHAHHGVHADGLGVLRVEDAVLGGAAVDAHDERHTPGGLLGDDAVELVVLLVGERVELRGVDGGDNAVYAAVDGEVGHLSDIVPVDLEIVFIGCDDRNIDASVVKFYAHLQAPFPVCASFFFSDASVRSRSRSLRSSNCGRPVERSVVWAMTPRRRRILFSMSRG